MIPKKFLKNCDVIEQLLTELYLTFKKLREVITLDLMLEKKIFFLLKV